MKKTCLIFWQIAQTEKLENLSCLKTYIKPNTAQNPQKLTKMGYTRKLPKDSVLCFCDSRLMCAVDVLSIVACFSDLQFNLFVLLFFKNNHVFQIIMKQFIEFQFSCLKKNNLQLY